MFKVKYSFLVASLLTVPTLSYAFKLPVPALPQQESATATSGVPDAAAQESLVKRFVSAQTLSLAAQINFAKALGLAEQTGSLTVGKAADLVVIDQDISRAKPAKIRQAKFLLTMLNGKVVYQSPDY